MQARGFYWNSDLTFLCVYGILDFKYETQQTNCNSNSCVGVTTPQQMLEKLEIQAMQPV